MYIYKFIFLVQTVFQRDGLSLLWNEMVKDGEVVSNASDSLINAAGIAAKKGMFFFSYTSLFLLSRLLLLTGLLQERLGSITAT